MSETYWLVYLYRFEGETLQWDTLGIVENRNEWQEWWKDIVEGEKELPTMYNDGDWWISDRPVTFGLPELD